MFKILIACIMMFTLSEVNASYKPIIDNHFETIRNDQSSPEWLTNKNWTFKNSGEKIDSSIGVFTELVSGIFDEKEEENNYQPYNAAHFNYLMLRIFLKTLVKGKEQSMESIADELMRRYTNFKDYKQTVIEDCKIYAKGFQVHTLIGCMVPDHIKTFAEDCCKKEKQQSGSVKIQRKFEWGRKFNKGVFLVTSGNGNEYVVKEATETAKDMQQLINLGKTIENVKIVTPKYVSDMKNGSILQFMDKAKGSSLSLIFSDNLNEAQISEVSEKLISSICILNGECGILHGDLHLSNIYYDTATGITSFIDFDKFSAKTQYHSQPAEVLQIFNDLIYKISKKNANHDILLTVIETILTKLPKKLEEFGLKISYNFANQYGRFLAYAPYEADKIQGETRNNVYTRLLEIFHQHGYIKQYESEVILKNIGILSHTSAAD